MTLEFGHADDLVSGATQNYADAARPVLKVFATGKDEIASGLYFLLLKPHFILLADTTINKNPSSEKLAKIAAEIVRRENSKYILAGDIQADAAVNSEILK